MWLLETAPALQARLASWLVATLDGWRCPMQQGIAFEARRLWYALFGCGVLLVVGCRQDMHDQPRYEPFEASTVFEDGRSARPLVEGTVARGQLRTDTHFHAGRVDGELAEVLPMPLTRALLERGRERYNIFCAPCHDRTGGGNGMIVRRGMRQPPSFHIERLRQLPVGYYFDVITNGFGVMMDYASRIPPPDRWAITAYIRALQLSQHATLADVPDQVRQRLEAEKP